MNGSCFAYQKKRKKNCSLAKPISSWPAIYKVQSTASSIHTNHAPIKKRLRDLRSQTNSLLGPRNPNPKSRSVLRCCLPLAANNNPAHLLCSSIVREGRAVLQLHIRCIFRTKQRCSLAAANFHAFIVCHSAPLVMIGAHFYFVLLLSFNTH